MFEQETSLKPEPVSASALLPEKEDDDTKDEYFQALQTCMGRDAYELSHRGKKAELRKGMLRVQ